MADAGLSSPRFQSDTEDADVKDQKYLERLAMFEAAGVDVEAKTGADGRRANRGFTISVGGKVKVDDDMQPSLRSDKRAQTMPSMGIRRGDHVMSEEANKKLVEAQKHLNARRRRGSNAVSAAVIEEKELLDTWAGSEVISHVYGKMSEGQSHGDEREVVLCKKGLPNGFELHPGGPDHSKDLPGGLDNCKPIISCLKGSKGFRDTTPNQDNFSVTYFANGWALACAFDGHGPFGHLVSTRTVQTVPYFLVKSGHFPADMGQALIESFELSHKDVVAKSLEDGWDVQASGSTACAVCWKGTQIFTANCGDSRCVIGQEKDKKLFFETMDHKPNSDTEKERIEASGGEVRTQTYPDGWVNHRIFVKGEDYPGLCMARTLGDESVKNYGVIATPEIKECEVEMGKEPFLIIASDGVWEFMDSQFVCKAVAKKIATDGAENTVKKLQREAKKRWKHEEGDYCDDITSILIRFRG
eukprot:TRINITY_DN24360_c2_g1_i1.p1 TRINITY_DN24360_c2_g1~~TRINITY_DN24360_c2_g1_i1.p1  ORF type:complete len:499 (-),score=110.97 TRINITY_DN24360_c2_g1_i1:81-1493(-)